MKKIQYTIRGVSKNTDSLLRKHAVREGVSLNVEILSVLQRGLGLTAESVRHTDLDDLAGTWVADPEFDKAIKAQDQVDKEMWQ